MRYKEYEKNVVGLHLYHSRPRRRKTFAEMLKEEAKQFCLNTALHGYRFIVLPKRILLERKVSNPSLITCSPFFYSRIFWAIVCLVALTTALSLLFVAWTDFKKNPTVLVTDSNHHPVWQYEFPAVTVCDFNIISKKAALHLARNLTKGSNTNELVQQFRLLAQLIRNTRIDTPFSNFSQLQDILDEHKMSIETVMQKLTPSCDEILVRCLWKGEEKRCDSIFEQIKTTEGFCCSFNYFAFNHTFGGSLARKSPKEPRRVSGCGYQTGLEVMVNNNPDDYVASYIPSIGQKSCSERRQRHLHELHSPLVCPSRANRLELVFALQREKSDIASVFTRYLIRKLMYRHILIHNPYYFPDWTVQAILNQRRIVNLISLIPTITHSTEDIKRMDVDIRKCLFSHERKLIHFERYNYHNCMVECRMNLTRRQCRCIPFYNIYNPLHDAKHKICSLRDIPCLEENYELISNTMPRIDFSSLDASHGNRNNSKCDCLPDCEITEYVAESSYGVLSREFSMNQPSLYGGIDIKNHSVFRVFYNDLVGIKNRRDVRFDWHALLGEYFSLNMHNFNFKIATYYGGLLGLFLGFSFVSGVEIIYFFTIRLFVDATKNKSKLTRTKQVRTIYNPKIRPVDYDNFNDRGLMLHEDTEIRRRSIFNTPYLE
ncbi:sodium channel protein Nach [Leptinotarsa decemlineata]|uniref:sodium channel protein Nach n=1 Tax=Leptinotarsa decemlineata TaxID=7539 RepID=UPI003D309CF9